MPQSSSPGTGVEARPARKGEQEGASQLGQEGGESAGCRAGALASRGLGSLLRPPPRPFLSPDCPVTPTPGEPGGRQSILRAALQPLGATKAGSGDGEASAEDRLARSAAPRGAKLRPAAATELPSSGVSRCRSPQLLGSRAQEHTDAAGSQSTRAGGSLSTVPHTKPCAETQTNPAHQYANTRQHTGKTRTRKHVHSLRGAPCLHSLAEEDS